MISRTPKAKPRAPGKRRKPGEMMPFDPATYLETVAKGRTISLHKKKGLIFKQGDDADSVIYIRSGKVKITVLSAEGNEAVVAILGADEFLGEGWLEHVPAA